MEVEEEEEEEEMKGLGGAAVVVVDVDDVDVDVVDVTDAIKRASAVEPDKKRANPVRFWIREEHVECREH